jgi:hypothetical protein
VGEEKGAWEGVLAVVHVEEGKMAALALVGGSGSEIRRGSERGSGNMEWLHVIEFSSGLETPLHLKLNRRLHTASS